MNIDRVPPTNLDAERSVLGSMLMADKSATVIPQVIALLSEADLYRTAHQMIYTAATHLFEKGQAVDLLTVTEELDRRGETEQVGGPGYIDELIESVPTVENVEYYARMVKEESIRRQLIHITWRYHDRAFDAAAEVDELVNNIEADILTLRRGSTDGHVSPISTHIKPVFQHIDRLYKKQDHLIGLSTGFKDIDTMLCGLQQGQSIIVAGRTSMGKSTLVQNIVQHVSITNGISSVYFSPEMDKQSLTMRILASESEIPFHKMRSGEIDEEAWPRLTIAAGRLSEAPIYIDDTVSIKLSELQGRCYEAKLKYDIGLIVVDYLQLVVADGRHQNREQQVAAVSAGLKDIGRRLGVPILVVSQLNRAPENRPNKRPLLSDLRESGAIEQDADVVMMIYREQYYNRDEKQNITEVNITKQRNGPVGTVNLCFRPDAGRYGDMKKGAW